MLIILYLTMLALRYAQAMHAAPLSYDRTCKATCRDGHREVQLCSSRCSGPKAEQRSTQVDSPSGQGQKRDPQAMHCDTGKQQNLLPAWMANNLSIGP